MQFAQTATQRQTQQMSGEMLGSLTVLGMSAEDLARHLAEQAAANPYLAYRPPPALSARGGAAFDAAAALAAERPSLIAHVLAQIAIAFDSPADRRLALCFAEALEPAGWLGQPLPEIAAAAGASLARAEAVLRVLQGFEPTGIFARDLADCLRLQAQEAGILTWEVATLLDNLDLLAEDRRAELAERCDCTPADLPLILRQLRGLDPRPGLAFAPAPAPVFPPELIASRGADGLWRVTLNRASAPTLVVRADPLAGAAADPAARSARRRAMAEARALAQAVERRGDTLLRTAAVLVARQRAFLDGGPAQRLPLTLEDVAAELGLHASTISRAVSGRLIQTPARTLPLRAFFARPVAAGADGAAVSRDSVIDFVARTVGAEDPCNPLSDDAIVVLARRAGYSIARRTVAKYRGTLGLAASHERRRPAPAP